MIPVIAKKQSISRKKDFRSSTSGSPWSSGFIIYKFSCDIPTIVLTVNDLRSTTVFHSRARSLTHLCLRFRQSDWKFLASKSFSYWA